MKIICRYEVVLEDDQFGYVGASKRGFVSGFPIDRCRKHTIARNSEPGVCNRP